MLLIAFAGCSVVQGGPESSSQTLVLLKDWKTTGLAHQNQSAYSSVARQVNVWIEQKTKELELAAPQWLAQVNLTPPADLARQVEALKSGERAVQPEDGEVVATAVIEWLKGEYSASRSTEAASMSAAMRDYLWPEVARPPLLQPPRIRR